MKLNPLFSYDFFAKTGSKTTCKAFLEYGKNFTNALFDRKSLNIKLLHNKINNTTSITSFATDYSERTPAFAATAAAVSGASAPVLPSSIPSLKSLFTIEILERLAYLCGVKHETYRNWKSIPLETAQNNFMAFVKHRGIEPDLKRVLLEANHHDLASHSSLGRTDPPISVWLNESGRIDILTIFDKITLDKTDSFLKRMTIFEFDEWLQTLSNEEQFPTLIHDTFRDEVLEKLAIRISSAIFHKKTPAQKVKPIPKFAAPAPAAASSSSSSNQADLFDMFFRRSDDSFRAKPIAKPAPVHAAAASSSDPFQIFSQFFSPSAAAADIKPGERYFPGLGSASTVNERLTPEFAIKSLIEQCYETDIASMAYIAGVPESEYREWVSPIAQGFLNYLKANQLCPHFREIAEKAGHKDLVKNLVPCPHSLKTAFRPQILELFQNLKSKFRTVEFLSYDNPTVGCDIYKFDDYLRTLNNIDLFEDQITDLFSGDRNRVSEVIPIVRSLCNKRREESGRESHFRLALQELYRIPKETWVACFEELIGECPNLSNSSIIMQLKRKGFLTEKSCGAVHYFLFRAGKERQIPIFTGYIQRYISP